MDNFLNHDTPNNLGKRHRYRPILLVHVKKLVNSIVGASLKKTAVMVKKDPEK